MAIDYKFNKQMMTNIKAFVESKAVVNVGVIDAGKKSGESGDLTAGELAGVHEFGSLDGRVPERSFLRKTYYGRMRDFQKFMDSNREKIGKEIIDKGSRPVLEKIGAWWLNAIYKTFDDEGPGWPRLSPEYLKRKEKDYPNNKILIRTGALRQSIDFEVVE